MPAARAKYCLLLLVTAFLVLPAPLPSQAKHGTRTGSAHTSKGKTTRPSKSTGKSRTTAKTKPTGSRTAPKQSSKNRTSAKKTPKKSTPASRTRTSKKRSNAGKAPASAKRPTNAKPTRQDIRLKRAELEKIKEEIRQCEERLSRSAKQERVTLDRIDEYDRETALLRTLLSHLRAQVDDGERDIDDAEHAIRRQSSDLHDLQERYARSIVAAYRRGRTHDTELLLASRSLNQMFLRSRYLRTVTVRHRELAREIREKKRVLEDRKSDLEEKVAQHRETIGEKTVEESRLQRKTAEHRQLLEQVRADKSTYREQLRRKQIAANKIERLIADLVERERARRARSAAPKAGTRAAASADRALPSVPLSATAFGRLKGRLPWPVTHGTVIGSFGEQVNPRLGTVTLSNGIDIGVAAGTSVRAVADGTVSVSYYIAGYGNLLILDHGDDFYTVYAHLSQTTARVQQAVKAGQVIARSGEGISGPQLHFEIWRGRAKQNPVDWLAR